MALPHLFAGVTSAKGQQLDDDFDALGKLTPIICIVSGTNVQTLTPLTDTPTQTSYANYRIYTGVASGSNTAATTAKVGALATLPIYKDGAAGPAVLSGGEIVQNCALWLMYDSTLNSNTGGFHLLSLTALAGVPAKPSTLQINGGSTLTFMQSALATVTFSVTAAQTSQDQLVTFAGAAVNDEIGLGPPAAPLPNVSYTGFVPAAGTITVRALNASAASLTPTGGIFRLTARRYT